MSEKQEMVAALGIHDGSLRIMKWQSIDKFVEKSVVRKKKLTPARVIL